MTTTGASMTCTEYLSMALTCLDGEGGDFDVTVVMAHIETCSPCHAEYAVQRQVKYLVQRSAGCSVAPDGLRMRVVTRIQQVSVEYSSNDLPDREEQS